MGSLNDHRDSHQGAGFYSTVSSWFLFTSLMVRGGISFFLPLLLFSKALSPPHFSLLSPMLTQHCFRLQSQVAMVPTPQGTPTLSSLQYFAVPWGDQSQQLNTSTGIKYWKLARIANFRYFYTLTHTHTQQLCEEMYRWIILTVITMSLCTCISHHLVHLKYTQLLFKFFLNQVDKFKTRLLVFAWNLFHPLSYFSFLWLYHHQSSTDKLVFVLFATFTLTLHTQSAIHWVKIPPAAISSLLSFPLCGCWFSPSASDTRFMVTES